MKAKRAHAHRHTCVINTAATRGWFHTNTCLSFPSETLPPQLQFHPKQMPRLLKFQRLSFKLPKEHIHTSNWYKTRHNYHAFHNIAHLLPFLLSFLNQRRLFPGQLPPSLLLRVNESRGGTNVDRNQSDLSLKSCSPREAPMTPPLFLVFILKCVFPICATPVLLSSQVATKHFFPLSLRL